MANKTTNYNFTKPEQEDFYNILVYNDFLDSLDAVLKAKVEVENGKGLSANDYTDAEKDKLSGIAAGANKYTHPTTHLASIITESTTRRFFTDTERTKLSGIATGANNYTHPTTHPASMITQDSTHRFTTDSEKTAWNAKMDASDNVASATKLQTARTIDGVTLDGTASRHHYGTCSTAAATVAKTLAITGLVLSAGAKITVKFTYGISSKNTTLNVNGTGAKAIYYKNKPLMVDVIPANTTIDLVYSGSYWYVVGELSSTGSAAEYFGSFDLNNYTVPGCYVCHVSAENWLNAPAGWITSWLEVYGNGDIMTQVLREYTGRYMYIRGYYKSWSAWKKYTGA